MKKIFYHRLIFLIYVLLIYTNQAARSQNYFPTHIGNRWDYRVTFQDNPPFGSGWVDTFTVRVLRDTLMPNGKLYAKFQTDGKEYLSNFWRVDSHWVYLFNNRDSSELSLFNLAAVKNDRWIIGDVVYNHAACIGIDSINLQGKTYQTLVFGTDGLVGTRYYHFAKGLGLVKYRWTGEPPGTADENWNLLGCIIDGKEYGELVSEVEKPESISAFALNQNYPNPFSESTTIRFQISDYGLQNPNDQGLEENDVCNLKSGISLKLYDLFGREVLDLSSSMQSNESVVIHKSQLPNPGVYFYRMQVGEKVAARKLIYRE